MNKRYCAAVHPRGFSNEVTIYIFSTVAQRNLWINTHSEDEVSRHPYTISAKEVRALLSQKDDAVTTYYITAIRVSLDGNETSY